MPTDETGGLQPSGDWNLLMGSSMQRILSQVRAQKPLAGTNITTEETDEGVWINYAGACTFVEGSFTITMELLAPGACSPLGPFTIEWPYSGKYFFGPRVGISEIIPGGIAIGQAAGAHYLFYLIHCLDDAHIATFSQALQRPSVVPNTWCILHQFSCVGAPATPIINVGPDPRGVWEANLGPDSYGLTYYGRTTIE